MDCSGIYFDYDIGFFYPGKSEHAAPFVLFLPQLVLEH